MKKQCLKVFVIFAVTVLFASCEKKSSAQSKNFEPFAQSESAAVSAASESSREGGIDYDLSSMNANMVYAEVFNMMVEPEMYENKVIKMRGNFVVYENSPTTGGRTYAVLISDALACCQQGIEFHYDFQEDEPKDGEEITVTGVYVTALLQDDIFYNYVNAESVERS